MLFQVIQSADSLLVQHKVFQSWRSYTSNFFCFFYSWLLKDLYIHIQFCENFFQLNSLKQLFWKHHTEVGNSLYPTISNSPETSMKLSCQVHTKLTIRTQLTHLKKKFGIIENKLKMKLNILIMRHPWNQMKIQLEDTTKPNENPRPSFSDIFTEKKNKNSMFRIATIVFWKLLLGANSSWRRLFEA